MWLRSYDCLCLLHMDSIYYKWHLFYLLHKGVYCTQTPYIISDTCFIYCIRMFGSEVTIALLHTAVWFGSDNCSVYCTGLWFRSDTCFVHCIGLWFRSDTCSVHCSGLCGSDRAVVQKWHLFCPLNRAAWFRSNKCSVHCTGLCGSEVTTVLFIAQGLLSVARCCPGQVETSTPETHKQQTQFPPELVVNVYPFLHIAWGGANLKRVCSLCRKEGFSLMVSPLCLS